MKYLFITIKILFLISCRAYEAIDITKPSAYINSPQDGDLVSDTLFISAIGSDDTGIDYIELWINQEKTELKDYDPPYEFIVDTRSLTDIEEGESIELSVKAFDNSENESSLSSSVEVFLDNYPPEKVILNPIIEENGILQFKWEKCTDLDFYAYVITVNNSPFTLIDTIRLANFNEINIEYNFQDTEFFGIRVLDNGFKFTESNLVQPISFDFINVTGNYFYYGENNENVFVDDFQLMVSEVSNMQYRSYLSVAKELNEIDVNNIGPWVLDNDGNILYDLENGVINWNGTNFEIDGTQNPYLSDYPVTHVSYYGAKHFASFFDFELPSEVMWEKAAAGTGLFDYPWGFEFDDGNNPINEIKSSYANYFENEDLDGLFEPYEPGGEINTNISDPGLAPVRYLVGEVDEFWFFNVCPNECRGFNHMAGNVWEWVNNEFGYSGNQIAKGGSWRSSKQDLRVWSKKYLDAHSTGDHVGFRCSY
ncbi:MAG: hypothetical protein CMF96_01130 [Candidatus Marinimicrobia bacterium]|nr:hypothetical protein [Candidatus Neomarinimicrobiota bacterium]